MDNEDNLRPNDAPIGYGNPPERTRFKKGKSGNPRGASKGRAQHGNRAGTGTAGQSGHQ
jgi:hypothetical protein